MNDYIESSPTVTGATKKDQDLVEKFAKGGFKLTNFDSNVPSLVNSNVDPKNSTAYRLDRENLSNRRIDFSRIGLEMEKQS